MKTVISENIIENLREVYDPEIAINVYDLGLIYEININEAHVDNIMTLNIFFCTIAIWTITTCSFRYTGR